jgi:hypothetical protein
MPLLAVFARDHLNVVRRRELQSRGGRSLNKAGDDKKPADESCLPQAAVSRRIHFDGLHGKLRLRVVSRFVSRESENGAIRVLMGLLCEVEWRDSVGPDPDLSYRQSATVRRTSVETVSTPGLRTSTE